MDAYREIIRENIDYDILLQERPHDAEQIDGYRCDYPPLTAVEILNRKFVAENLSPGGCADLLAAALFLYSL